MTPEQWSTIRHFVPQEFACRDAIGAPCAYCGGREGMDYHFVLRLDTARDLLGEPMVVTSGSRCPIRNKEVGGSPISAHLFEWQESDGKQSMAADLADHKDPVYRGRLLEALWGAGFRQFEASRDGHLHVHLDNAKPSPFLGIEP